MHVAELRYAWVGDASDEAVATAAKDLLHALRQNGQICGREHPIARGAGWATATVLLLAPDALDPQHHNQYVRLYLDAAPLGAPAIRILGPDPGSAEPCACPRPGSYVLFTDYRSLESPIRCGDCFDPVPLYRLPSTYHGEYYDIIRWMGDFQDCDSLQMGCRVLERAAMRQLGDAGSPLSRQGREICARLAGLAGVPVYYRLLRQSGRSQAAERQLRCPGCCGAWLLGEPWHGFEFRCDACGLVSAIAYNLQSA
ncbi:MAG TPA: DUF2310 family Zn-ribbon-containing protein [Herpetosiphonaceae bacterium]